MLPWELLGEAVTPDGSPMTLSRRGNDYAIRVNGQELMGSRMWGSEEGLVAVGCEHTRTMDAPRILIGGLGMGFTLRKALDVSSRRAEVVVAELMPCVVEWMRGPLAALADHTLDDPRVKVALGDVGQHMRDNPGRYDSIMLDVDNGPTALTVRGNAGLYGDEGLAVSKRALRKGGVYAVWSAGDDTSFTKRMKRHGFEVEVRHVRGRSEGKGPRHTLFVGRV